MEAINYFREMYYLRFVIELASCSKLTLYERLCLFSHYRNHADKKSEREFFFVHDKTLCYTLLLTLSYCKLIFLMKKKQFSLRHNVYIYEQLQNFLNKGSFILFFKGNIRFKEN